jgi:hypothetical protein
MQAENVGDNIIPLFVCEDEHRHPGMGRRESHQQSGARHSGGRGKVDECRCLRVWGPIPSGDRRVTFRTNLLRHGEAFLWVADSLGIGVADCGSKCQSDCKTRNKLRHGLAPTV